MSKQRKRRLLGAGRRMNDVLFGLALFVGACWLLGALL